MQIWIGDPERALIQRNSEVAWELADPATWPRPDQVEGGEELPGTVLAAAGAIAGWLRWRTAAGARSLPPGSGSRSAMLLGDEHFVDCALLGGGRLRAGSWRCGGSRFGFAMSTLGDHAPGFPRGGSFHPDRSYSFVGPAAGFAISPVQTPVAGGTSMEAIRHDILPVAGNPDTMCQFEERIDAGLNPLQQFCLCGSPNGPFQWTISDLGLGGSCGTSMFTAGGPFLPGYLSMGIGRWTDPTTYPGTEQLKWSSGGYDYFEPCSGTFRPEVFYGVTTQGGYDAFQINAGGLGPDIPEGFVDQGNSLRKNNNTLTVMNIPYATDHVLNLNF